MNRLEQLWKGYQQGLLNQAELAELLQLLQTEDSPLAGMIDTLLQQEATATPPPEEKEAILQHLRQQLPAPPSKVHWLRRYRWVAAATFLLLSGSMLWFSIDNNNKAITGKGRASAPVTDAAPGKNGAVLTLADGSTILLDSGANTVIPLQGDNQVNWTGDGALSYQPGRTAAQHASMAMNTITVPTGRQFQVVLSDGSKVWLNSASTLTYPVAFEGKERLVSITGEAYFEVNKATQANGAAMPFRVAAPGTVIEVMGTHFNINAYADENAVRTTLLEGRVKVADGDKPTTTVVLQPGQQAANSYRTIDPANSKGPAIQVRAVNVEQVVAWKNGLFNFHQVNLPAMMRQLARWYNVPVEYRGPVPDRLFGGEIERSLQLSQALKILERMGIHCTIENGKLVVHETSKR